MGKGKRGRPRADRPRYPSGQVKPVDPTITVAAWQRVRAHAARLSGMQIVGTQLGRLGFIGELNETEVATGLYIAEIYGRYDRAMGRRRSAASPSYEMGRGRDHGSRITEAERLRNVAAVHHFGELQAEIRLCPRGVKSALEELCVEDRACPPTWLPAVKIALDVLAVSLRLTRRRPSS